MPAESGNHAPVIHPRAVFTLETARAALGLNETTLPREIRLGRLRASKRAGRVWILGRWLLAWLASGRVRRKRPCGDRGGRRIEA